MSSTPGAGSSQEARPSSVQSNSARTILDRLSFFLLAALIGALVGGATLLLIEFIRLVQALGYGTGTDGELGLAAAVAALPPWRVVLVPALGGLFVGILMHFMPGQRYHGIADVMEACAMNSARMGMSSSLGAALASGISLGVGAPLGREGPAVHIGASLSAWIAERLGLDHKRSLALLGCGAAAAVAVSFNTPIAAVIFALEVVVGYYTLRVFAPIVIAVMLAMVVRQFALDGAPLFTLPPREIDAARELPLFALLGLGGALAARALIGGIELAERLWHACRVPRWLRPALAGAAIGLVATQLPLVLGIGLEGTSLALAGTLGLVLVAVLLIAKLALVALAFGSGFAGGVFGPAVFIGAMLGSTFWHALELIGPAGLAGPGTYAAIGMAAVASALLGAPISTVLIVFELTRDYAITLGVMTAAAVASTAMQFGPYGSFFRWQLARRDVNISAGRDISLLIGQSCEPLLSSRFVSAADSVTCGELESRMGTERQRLAVFVDEDGAFRGSITLSGLISHAIENGLQSKAIDAAFGVDFSIRPSTNIVSAVQTMAERQVEFLPVVERFEEAGGAAGTPAERQRWRLLGVVLKSDLLAEHYDVVKRAREDEFGVT